MNQKTSVFCVPHATSWHTGIDFITILTGGMPMSKIPSQLQNEKFRFVKIKKGEKRPFEKGWTENSNYQWNDPMLQEWILNGGNYGVMGGHGNLTIIDVDEKEVWEKIEAEMPKTFTIKTGSGCRHFYYFCDDIEHPMRMVSTDIGKMGDVGDIQGKGKQVVGPGSIHPNGNVYEILNDIPIAKVTKKEIVDTLFPYIAARTSEYSTEEKEYAEKFNISTDKVIELEQLNKKGNGEYQGPHPIHGSESGMNFCVNVDKGVWHCFRCGSGGGLLSWIAVKEGFIKCYEAVPGSLRGDIFKKVLTIARDKYNLRINNPSEYFEGSRFVPKRLGDKLMCDFSFKTLKGSDKIYFYSGGVYKKYGDELIKELVANELGDKFSQHHTSETLAYIRASTYIDPEEVNNGWVNLKNGLIDPSCGEFIPHTPEIFSTVQLPIIYDSDADCPMFKEMLKSKCDKDWKYHLVQEMFGYPLLNDQRFEKAFLFYGPKRTMKSTTLYLLGKMLGNENVTAFTLQQLSEDKYAPAYLYGTPANICADLTSKELKSTGMFMQIVGQDKITASKKHEHQMSFYPTTKLIFSCNAVPGTTNKDAAFYRRWILIEFAMQTKESEIKPGIRHELEKELSGILNWSIKGLKRLLDQNKFTYPYDDEKVKDMYESASDSISSFIHTHIDTEDDIGAIPKREVYNRYKTYCKENRLPVENPIKFGRVFFAYTGCGNRKLDTIPAYSGVNWKPIKEVS